MIQPLVASFKDRPVYDVLGDRYTVLLSAEETGGAYFLFEMFATSGKGPPPHVHSGEDESFYILSGEIDFNINGKVTRARAGDIVFAPRNIPHSFMGASSEPARMICLVTPGEFENFFASIGKKVVDKSTQPSPPTQVDISRLLEIAPKFGIEILQG